MTSAPSLWAITRRSLVKDLRLEWRSKDAINSMLFFALLVVVIFSFGFDPTAEESRKIAGGLLWVAILFATVVALNQTWTRELRNQVLDAYRLSPAPPQALFLSKTVGNFIFVSILEVLMVPLFVVFYNLRSVGPGGSCWWWLCSLPGLWWSTARFSRRSPSVPAAAKSCCPSSFFRFRFRRCSPW